MKLFVNILKLIIILELFVIHPLPFRYPIIILTDKNRVEKSRFLMHKEKIRIRSIHNSMNTKIPPSCLFRTY